MTSKAESLAEAIMKMAEEDKGLVKSKLVEMIEAHANQNLVTIKTKDEWVVPGSWHDAIAAKDAEIEFRPLTHEELYGPARK